MISKMGPGQIEPNEFELAILDRILENRLTIRLLTGRLRVLSRTFTGVGCLTNFRCDESVPEVGKEQLSLGGPISMPNVATGMGAVLFLENGQPKCLETFTYGDDHWDGVFDGFLIGRTA